MTAPKRTLLGSESGISTRQRAFETDEGIIIESTDQYEVSRKSVLFEDVVLVTYHRQIGWAYVLVLTAIAVLILAVAGVFLFTAPATGAPVKVSAIIAAFAIPFLILIAVRLVMKVDVISIFGRRSRAQIHFSFRKRRARDIYGRICHRTRQAQRVPQEISQPQSVE